MSELIQFVCPECGMLWVGPREKGSDDLTTVMFITHTDEDGTTHMHRSRSYAESGWCKHCRRNHDRESYEAEQRERQ